MKEEELVVVGAAETRTRSVLKDLILLMKLVVYTYRLFKICTFRTPPVVPLGIARFRKYV